MTNKIVVDFLRVCIRVNRYCESKGFTTYKGGGSSSKWPSKDSPYHHILKVIRIVGKCADMADKMGEKIEGQVVTLEEFICSIDQSSSHYKHLKEGGSGFWDGLDAQGPSDPIDKNIAGFYEVNISGACSEKPLYELGLAHFYGMWREPINVHWALVEQRLWEIAYLQTSLDPFNSIVALYAMKQMHIIDVGGIDTDAPAESIAKDILLKISAKPADIASFYGSAFLLLGIYTRSRNR